MKYSPSSRTYWSTLRFSQLWQRRGAAETFLTCHKRQSPSFFSQPFHRSSQHRRNGDQSGPVERPVFFAQHLVVSASLAALWVFLGFNMGREVIFGLRARFLKMIVHDSDFDDRLARSYWERACRSPVYQKLVNHPGLEPVLPLVLSPEQEMEIQQAAAKGTPRKDLHHFVLNALHGSRGLITQAFVGRDTKNMYVYAVFGHGMEGSIPGQVSSGAMAAILQDSIRLWAKYYFPADTSYRLTELDLEFARTAPVQYPLTIGIASSQSSGKLGPGSMLFVGPKPDLPSDWFDPNNWETCVNSATAVIFVDDPSDWRVAAGARGLFEVDHSESWPPPAPRLPPALSPDGVLK